MVPAPFRSGRSLAAAAAAGGCLLAAGCGSSSPRGLTAGAETRLLAYVSDARADANGHDLSAVRSSLAGFIGYVGRLRGTGRVDAATAVRLDAEARAALQETITGSA